MHNFDFNKIIYKKPYLRRGSKYIRDVIGIDTETLISGKPFMICTSLGECFSLADMPDKLFSRDYRGKNLVAFNLKFDSGSILYNLPLERLNELREKTFTIYDVYHYTYIPHKLLRIGRGKNAVSIWDISGFYKMGLDKAAKKYLNKSKLETETKKFTATYAKEHYEELKKYCIKDAELTRELALFYLDKLHKIGLYPNTLYSTASIAFQYFKQHSHIVTVWDLWENDKEVLRYGCNAYYGGKVEVTARGSFTGYEYDINSAYAYEIRRLVDISGAKVLHNKKYVSEAAYGLYHVYIHDIKTIAHSIVVKINHNNVYPAGSFYAYITKRELEYLYKNNIDVKILSAYHLLVTEIKYPYAATVAKLQAIKEEYKETEPFISLTAKLCNNSFYGKMAQLIEDYEGNLIAGVGWQPVYSSAITANVRLAVSELQNRFKEVILAVHTDSIITTKELPLECQGEGLGAFSFKRKGAGIVIMSGMYKLGSKNAYRGFKMPSSFNWSDKLSEMGDKSKIELSFTEARSWIKAVISKAPDTINRFIDDTKILDLNAERKRLWLSKTNGNKLLEGLEQSIPLVYVEPYDKGVK